MNKIIYGLIAALMSTAVYAQKISSGKVPPAVVSAFKARFPDVAKTKWEIENVNEYEAGFQQNGQEISANFDAAGKWLETEIEIKTSELPPSVQSSLNTEFAGYKINEASKIESLKNGNCFEAEIEKGEETVDVLFTADGKVLSQAKTEEEKRDND